MSKVLVIRMSSFGDVAMLVPVIYSVAAKYPQTRFSVLTRKAFAPLFQNLNFNVSVIPVDLNHRHKGIRGIFRIGRRLLGMGFSHVADEHDVLRSKILRTLMKLTGCKVAVIDKGRREKDDMIKTNQTDIPLKPTIERYREVFDKLGFPAEIIFNNIFDFVPRNFSSLKGIVAEKKGKWIAIAPFAKHRGKIYPLEKMEYIIKALYNEDDNSIFLLGGGAEEQKIFSKWCVKYPKLINTIGKLNLEKELLLISYMDVMISMDSANMHLASLVQTPVVSIWGATHPSMGFYGFNQNPDNAVQVDLECRPCSVYGDQPCQRIDYACLEYITENTILEKVHKILNSRNT